ncbi:unnamed protein product [Calypogeia fissa]
MGRLPRVVLRTHKLRKRKTVAYISSDGELIYQLGRVTVACNPSGGRRLWRWSSLVGRRAHVDGAPARRVESIEGAWSEGQAPQQLERRAKREAGNRAAITSRSTQSRDHVPECHLADNPQGSSPATNLRNIFFSLKLCIVLSN